MIKGDEALEALKLTGIAMIKIDVEGAELEVITGLSKTIARHRPALLFEVLPNYQGDQREYLPTAARAENIRRATALWDRLISSGYGIFQVNSQGAIHKIHAFDLDNRDYCGRDYLAKPERV